MRAVVWQGDREIAVERVDDPSITAPTDAIVRVVAAGVCGSDLHLFDHGATLAMKPGDILGHETVGIVEETGPAVGSLTIGELVVVPFNVACGRCWACRSGLQSQCDTTRDHELDKGGALLGYTHLYGGVPGGQAEYLRVPHADYGPFPVPAGVDPAAAVLAADVLPTAWQAVEYADVRPGSIVCVHGLGPVGAAAARIALHRGAAMVIGVDPAPDRRRLAEQFAVVTVDSSALDVPRTVQELTRGRGADCVIDAVGMDASGSAIDKVLQTSKVQPDRLNALHEVLGSVRRGGTVSIAGVYVGSFPAFPLGALFDRQVTLRMGQANVRRWADDVVDAMTADGDPLGIAGMVTHELPLDLAVTAYQAFRDKKPGVRKVVLRPGLEVREGTSTFSPVAVDASAQPA